ncbi:MAG: GNAT family N-acetyltransferase [Pyrinomonadaceae bacterium]
MGCYPLFTCQNWSRLADDLKQLENDLLSLTLVTDPFGDYSVEELQACFPDRFLPFKKHFIVALDARVSISKHHRYYAERARKAVQVSAVAHPNDVFEDWIELYSYLSSRHELRGIKKFSSSAFAQQLSVPGVVIFRATEAGKTVGAHIWYVQRDIAHSHLAAVNERGYELMAAYALHAYAIEYFQGKLRALDLGGAPGLNDYRDGLTRFKLGWSNGTKTAYLCGRIFNHRKYDEIVSEVGSAGTDHFPAYRAGEFK